MLVYGDPSFDETLDVAIARLRERLARTREEPDSEALRTLLILAGQIEQAAEDAPATPQRALEAIREATSYAAAAFHADWAARDLGRTADTAVSRALEAMSASLVSTPNTTALRVRVKMPEGFSSYALFPEHYCGSAARWLAGRAPGRALVLGVRSIGTTLSALVSAALASAGWAVRRVTVRPFGPPFTRRVELAGITAGAREWGLVVDEGPGLSGSSMAAAGEALARAGIERARIACFPGHAGDPPAPVSDTVRAFWHDTPRFVLPAADARVSGRSLEPALAAAVEALQGAGPAVVTVNLGGGLWRDVVYAKGASRPPAYAPFARSKYLIATRSGSHVLLKFEGLAAGRGLGSIGAEIACADQAARARAGFTVAPLGVVHGFVARPWVDGEPLTAADAEACEMPIRIGRYLAASSGPPLGADEQEESLARLAHMLHGNAREALGDAAGEGAMRAAARARASAPATSPLPSSGDGRLAPEEWLRDPRGRVWKASCGRHDRDPTIIGRQCIAWDIAGALEEWHLSSAGEAALLAAFQSAGGPSIPASTITFHRLAYLAFRLGLATVCAVAARDDPDEQARLLDAARGYERSLAARGLGGDERERRA